MLKNSKVLDKTIGAELVYHLGSLDDIVGFSLYEAKPEVSLEGYV